MIDMWLSVIENSEKCKGKTFTIGPEWAIKIRDYAEMIGRKLKWRGKINWHTKDPRPGEIYWLCSNHRLITETIGWEPKTSFDDLVSMMVDHDIDEAKREKVLIENNLLEPTWEFPT